MANMKNYKVFALVSLVGVSLGLSGCGQGGLFFGGQTDPLSGKEKVQDGTKDQIDDVLKPSPISSDAIMIDSVAAFGFQTNSTDSIEIGARVFFQGYAKKISIANLADFPGATFDANTGIFTWNPPASIFVGLQKIWKADMIVRVTATGPNGDTRYKEKTISITVDKVPTGIRIVRAGLVNPLAPIIEGSSNNFLEAIVEDANATTAQETWPNLVIENGVSTVPSAANFTFVKSRVNLANNQYKFTLSIEPDSEVTKNRKAFQLLFRATSPAGVQSSSTVVNLDVTNRLSSVKTSWVEAVVFYTGQKNSYSFVYYNPKEEGYIQNPNFTKKPAGLSISCPGSPSSARACSVSWDLTASPISAGNYNVSSTVETTNDMWFSSGKVTDNFTHLIKVVAGPAPAPDGGQ